MFPISNSLESYVFRLVVEVLSYLVITTIFRNLPADCPILISFTMLNSFLVQGVYKALRGFQSIREICLCVLLRIGTIIVINYLYFHLKPKAVCAVPLQQFAIDDLAFLFFPIDTAPATVDTCSAINSSFNEYCKTTFAFASSAFF